MVADHPPARANRSLTCGVSHHQVELSGWHWEAPADDGWLCRIRTRRFLAVHGRASGPPLLSFLQVVFPLSVDGRSGRWGWASPEGGM
jgi:hypothetical protein